MDVGKLLTELEPHEKYPIQYTRNFTLQRFALKSQ